MVIPLLPETSSLFWPRRCPEFRWSGHFRLRHPRDPAFWICPEIRWSCPFRLRHPRNCDLGDALPRGWSGHFRPRHPRNSGFGDALSSGDQATFVRDIVATLTSGMACPMVVRPLSPETSSQLWVPRCPELWRSGHFRLRRPRKSDLGDALPHGGRATFA